MGFLKKLEKSIQQVADDYASKPNGEQTKNYQRDSYYTDKVPTMSFDISTGEPAIADVPTYKERIKNAVPSNGGLYPPEILLLFYCYKYHKYPNPKNGYPGLWWFQYGIRNVDSALESLANRGFLVLGDDDKYAVTDKGQQELDENEYVEFTHRNSKWLTITPWTVNKVIKSGDKNQVKTVEKLIKAEDDGAKQSHNEFMDSLKDSDPETYQKLDAQDKQLAEIQQAEKKYESDGDADTYIKFWENIWNGTGLLFNGSRWMFRLADLYIQQKEMDKAWSHLNMLSNLPQRDYRQIDKSKVSSYQVKVLKQEKRYVPAIEFVMRKYGYDAPYVTVTPKIDPERFIGEIKPFVGHIKKDIDKDEAARKLLDILNNSVSNNKFDVIKMHKDLKAFLEQYLKESNLKLKQSGEVEK